MDGINGGLKGFDGVCWWKCDFRVEYIALNVKWGIISDIKSIVKGFDDICWREYGFDAICILYYVEYKLGLRNHELWGLLGWFEGILLRLLMRL